MRAFVEGCALVHTGIFPYPTQRGELDTVRTQAELRLVRMLGATK